MLHSSLFFHFHLLLTGIEKGGLLLIGQALVTAFSDFVENAVNFLAFRLLSGIVFVVGLMSRLVNVHIPSSVLLLATHGLLQLVEETVFTLVVMAARLVVSRCAVPEVPAVDAIATGLFAPVENQEQTEEHTAQAHRRTQTTWP